MYLFCRTLLDCLQRWFRNGSGRGEHLKTGEKLMQRRSKVGHIKREGKRKEKKRLTVCGFRLFLASHSIQLKFEDAENT